MTQQDRQENSPETIVVDCDLDEPPEKVWRMLTEPQLLAQWLMPNDIRPEIGERFSFRPYPANGNDAISRGTIDCKVLAAEPRRLLRYSWRGPESERDADGRTLDTIVTFVLGETAKGGTHLRVIHSGFPLPLHLGVRRRPGPTALSANANTEPWMRLAA